MIKFKNFIKEDTSSDVETILNILKDECSDICKTIINEELGPLYRGMKLSGYYDEKTSREKRAPRNSYGYLQDIFDSGLRNAGMTALRGNSIFVTSDIRVASFYAYEGGAKSSGNTLCVVFPKNGFHYTWTQKHTHDLVLTNHDVSKQIPLINDVGKDKQFQLLKKLATTPAEKGFIFDMEHAEMEYGPNNIQNITQLYYEKSSGEFREAMEGLDRLYSEDAIKRFFKLDQSKFEQMYAPTNKDIEKAAIRKVHEILIHGDYLAINNEFFQVYIKDKFIELFS